MTLRWLAAGALSLGLAVAGSTSVFAADAKPAKKPEFTFSALRTATPEVARQQAQDWLKSVGKADADTQKALDAIWAQADRSVLDRTADSLMLGSDAARKLMTDIRNPSFVPADAELPALLKDAKQAPFFRANLSLAYAKELSNRRSFEETVEALAQTKPEDVVDPATYLFHKAVAEHGLVNKPAAVAAIIRMLDDVPDAPERYKMVASLMFFDLEIWKKDGKDLGTVRRLMDNSERRLGLDRGGKKTQDIQKKIVFRLDEIIKEKENQAKGNGSGSGSGNGPPNGGQCPGGGQSQPGNTTNPSSPQQDSMGGTTSTPGKVPEQLLKKYAEKWGTMPEKERAKAMAEMTQGLPPRYKEIIENYFRSLARSQP